MISIETYRNPSETIYDITLTVLIGSLLITLVYMIIAILWIDDVFWLKISLAASWLLPISLTGSVYLAVSTYFRLYNKFWCFVRRNAYISKKLELWEGICDNTSRNN